MTTSTMKMPASYSAIEAEEMTYLDGGASNAYQAFLDVGKVFNYIARIFSGASSIINNVNVITSPLYPSEQPAGQLRQ